MFKRLILLFLVLFTAISFASANEIFTCKYDLASNCNYDDILFYSSSNKSANVEIRNSNPTYDYAICCSSPKTNVSFSTVDLSVGEECSKNEPLIFFTSSINARLASEYNPNHHKYALCYDVPDKSYALSIQFVPKDGLINNFQCLFRASDNVNSHTSSCDWTYNGGETYKYSVIAQLFEGMDVLSCANDCTNKLSGRVDYACSLKFTDLCSNVPIQCSGSLTNSWVSYNSTHEVKCSSPWQSYRYKAFTQEKLEITTTVQSCDNLIKVPYSTILNNEIVSMNIFICGD